MILDEFSHPEKLSINLKEQNKIHEKKGSLENNESESLILSNKIEDNLGKKFKFKILNYDS